MLELKHTYVIFLYDIDPDVGDISQMIPVAYTEFENYAIQITEFLNSSDEEPNRSYKYFKL